MKNIKCKAGPIPSLSLRTASAPSSTSLNQLMQNSVLAAGKESSTVSKPSSQDSKTVSNRETTGENLRENTKLSANSTSKIHSNLETPKYTIVHRGSASMQQCLSTRIEVETRRPKELVVYIELQKLSSINAVELDVNDTEIHLKNPLYSPLVITLPYKVDENQTVAKFDKSTKKLSIVLPLLPMTQVLYLLQVLFKTRTNLN